jgi:hypothetical protein
LKDDAPEAVKAFEDRQFAKAVEHLREKLGQGEKKIATAPGE